MYMSNLPILYLCFVILLFLIFSYILTQQVINLYIENKQIDIFQKNIALKTRSKDELYRISQIYWRKKLYSKALPIFQLVLHNRIDYADDQTAQIYFQLGQLYTQMENYNKAIKNYNLSLQIVPNNKIIMLQLASVLKKNKQYNLAEQIYNQL
uniref:hypothetical protein n=1 Tax=Stylonema alsidii TaxID=35155 RepID=UPI001FCDA0BA|nr:hypothetical protein MW559_pgp187 [Stylonema alsidii]UNJ15105.1 hypothetical protein [Stylonema alsidii]